MLAAQLVLALLIAVAVLVSVARRLRLPYPILLVIGGLALGFVPGLPRVEIPPDLIFLLVLPPLLYAAAFFTPVRDFRANLGAISSLAVGLVVASALAVAFVAQALVAGITWPAALALGAIVAPPDAVAASALARRFAVPRRIVTVLEGESLLNDGIALTLYRAALAAAALAGALSPAASLASFVLVALGGVAIGVIVGFAVAWVRTRLSDTPVEITISLLTPYAAYLPADLLGVSGVLAVVVAGLYVGRRSSRIMGSGTRLTGQAVWEMLTFLLSGFVFILMGLQISLLVNELALGALLELAIIGLAVCLTLVVVRGVWIFASAYLPRLLRRRPRTGLVRAQALVLSWAGMRGVVSLAAALALPVTLADGTLFPARDALVVVTFTVILVTLLGQGLTLPLLIRWVGLARDEDDRLEEARARRLLREAATGRIREMYAEWPTHRELLDQLRTVYRHRTEHAERDADTPGSAGEQELLEHRQIRRAVIESEREALLRLRDQGAIDDDVLRRIERDLDLEELRMEA